MRTHDYNETDQPTILATYIYIEGKKKKKESGTHVSLNNV